jgi:predicted outer membrane repeat protein
VLRAASTLALIATLTAPSSATVIRVDASGGGDYLTLGDGMAGATTGDTVLVAPGLYAGDGNRDLSLGTRNLVIVSEAGAEETTVDCGGAARAFLINGNQTDATVIEGFTITNAFADTGGAIRISNGSSPVVRSCAFVLNTAEHGGAISIARECGARIRQCAFTDNSALARGGAAYLYGAWIVEIDDSSFTGNEAVYGGAVYSSWCSPHITDSTFDENRAEQLGGAIASDLGSLTVASCELTENAAVHGGGLHAVGGTLRMHGCEFSSNVAEQHGGGAFLNVSPGSTVSDCSFTANNGGWRGGGAYCFCNSSPSITRTTFAGNVSGYLGAGVFLTNSTAWISGCDFIANGAATAGGGTCSLDCDAVVTGCTYAENASSYGGGAYVSGGVPTVSGCIFRGNSGEGGAAVALYSGAAGTISGCTFVENTEIQAPEGGAIFFQDVSTIVTNTIIAFTVAGQAVSRSVVGSDHEIVHCCVFGNAGGDTLVGTYHDNIFVDPLFCGFYDDDFTLCGNSVCLPGNNPWGELVGALDLGCPNCYSPAAPLTWGRIKAIFR